MEGTENHAYTAQEFSLVKMMEQERRYWWYTLVTLFLYDYSEWAEERIKLIHCLHLQQLELNQRATAAHEKAMDIAKVYIDSVCYWV